MLEPMTFAALRLAYLFAPAFVANAMPIIAARIPWLDRWNSPIDERHFGAHKTWRGLATGMAAAVIVALLQYALGSTPPFAALTLFRESVAQSVLIGVLLGAGALGGDLAKSFAKRALKRPPGSPWIPWDAVDYMIGALLFLWPVYFPHPLGAVFLLILGPALSRIANLGSYMIGWKKVWY